MKYFCYIYFNIIYIYLSRSSKIFIFITISDYMFAYIIFLLIHAVDSFHPALLDFSRTLHEIYKSLSSSLCLFLYFYQYFPPWDANILQNTLFSNTLYRSSSLRQKYLVLFISVCAKKVHYNAISFNILFLGKKINEETILTISISGNYIKTQIILDA